MKINVKRILAGLLIFCIILSLCYQSLASEGEVPESIGEEHIELVEDIPTEEESHTDESETENEPVVPDENLEVTESSEEQEIIEAPINDEIEENIELYFNEDIGISQISVNANHTLILFKNGDLYSMGNNEFGQLGNGEQINSITVVTTPIATGIVQIATGKFHSLALTDEGKVLSWGRNNYGQLGRTDSNTYYPQYVTHGDGYELSSVIKIAAGTFNSMALTSDGKVWTFGYNVQGQLGSKSELEYDSNPNCVIDEMEEEIVNIIDIKSGPYHCVALSDEGFVYTWGQGNYGRLGVGTIRNYSYAVPVQTGIDAGILNNVVKIGVGSFHTMAVTSYNDVYVWGRNNVGQLGVGDTEDKYYPVLAECDFVEDNPILDVTGGDYHSIILLNDGSVCTSGSNDKGQLGGLNFGEQNEYFGLVDNIGNIVKISSSSNQIMSVDSNGKVYCWGHNNKGQFGNLSIGIYYLPIEMEANIGVYKDTHGNTYDTATQLTLNHYENGVIDYNLDVDVFVFDPEISADYLIDVTSDFSNMEDVIIYDLTNMSEIPYEANGYYFLEYGKRYAIIISDYIDVSYYIAVLSAPEIIRVIQSAYSLGLDGETEIDEITSGYIKGKVEVRNSANIPKSFVVIMTLYDGDNVLYDIRTVESNVQPLTNAEVTCGFNVPSDYENYRVVLSVWDNLQDMNNLVDEFVLD